MATQIVIDVSLEAQGVVENIQKIEAELNKLNAERDALLQSGLSTEALTSSLNSLDSEISKLNGTYDKLVQSTNSYEQATNKATETAEKTAAAQAKVERQIKTAEGVTKTLAGSVNLATSAFALFGVQNEEVQKSLLKVQAAAAFSTGIKDLVEGTKALNTANIALNSTLLKNPYVLVAALVAGLVLTFVDFEDIIAVVTSAVSFAFGPIEDLFSLFGDGTAKEIDKVKEALDEYNSSVATAGVQARLRIAEQEQEIARLALFGATEEDLALKRRAIITDNIRDAEAQVEAANKALKKISSDSKATEKQIQDAQNAATDARANQIAADTALDNFDAQLKKTKADREKNANKEAADRRAKNVEDEKRRIDELLAALRKQIQTQEELAKKAGEEELANLKLQLLNREITQEQFDGLRVQNDIKTNDLIAENLKKFQISEEAQLKIGADNVTTLLNERNIKVIQAERKNVDIRIAEQKKNDEKLAAETAAFDKELTDSRLAQIETDYLQKVLELNGKYNLENEIEAKQHSIELQQIEIDKQKALLLTVDVGSQQYFDIVKKINDAEVKIAQDKADLEVKIEKDKRDKILEFTAQFAEGIRNIIQDVSPLFESVGQTALQSLDNISSGAEQLIATLTDETLTSQQKLLAGIGFASSAIGELNAIFQQNAEERVAEIDKQEQERIASLQRQKEAGLITEQQLATGVAQIEAEAQKKRRQEQKKAFQAEKAIRITQAVLQTAQATLAAFSSGVATPFIGPATGAIFAGIAAAFGAAQIAIIASQKFPDEGGGGTATTPSVPGVPTQAAQGSITPTQFQPNVFGTGVAQEETFGASTTNANTGGNVLRAYVVESDIASTSQRLNTIRTTSEL